MKAKSVVVVGASFGGLACAQTILEQNAGTHVYLVDRENPPIPRTTGGIANWWFADLHITTPPEAVATEISGVRMIGPSGGEVIFKFEKPIAQVLYSEKWVEHYISRCYALGAEILLGATCTNLEGDSLLVVNGGERKLQADVIIAADGANSTIGRFVGRPDIDPMDLHLGYEHTIDASDNWDSDIIHLVFDPRLAPKGYCWYFPEGKTRARVGLGIPRGLNENPKSYFEKFCDRYPELKKPPHKVLGGQIPTAPLPKSNIQGNVLFVGDAGRFCSPLHGGGIGFAAQSGVYAAEVVVAGKRLSAYDKMWKKGLGRLLKRHYLMKQLIYSWGVAEFDRAISAMHGYQVKGENPNLEVIGFVGHLFKTDPGLIPTFLVNALRARF